VATIKFQCGTMLHVKTQNKDHKTLYGHSPINKLIASAYINCRTKLIFHQPLIIFQINQSNNWNKQFAKKYKAKTHATLHKTDTQSSYCVIT